MNDLIADSNRNIVLFINDFDQEFADGVEKLSRRLERPLKGVILLDRQVKAKGLNTPDGQGLFEQVVCDYSDDMSLHATLKRFEKNILLVTCSGETNQDYLKRLLPHVPYIYGPTERSLDWATNKVLMRKMLKSYDDNLVPKFLSIADSGDDEIEKILSSLQFPVIAKPVGLDSSILVTKIDNETELRAVLKKSFMILKDIYRRDRGRGEPGMIVEEFIDGEMYSSDVYVNETGKVSPLPFLRVKTAYAYGLDGFYTHQTDSYQSLTEEETAMGYETAANAVHALGLRSCVAHVELYLTKDGWKVIELGPRAGGQRQEIYELSYGVDHAYNELLTKVGLEPELKTEHVQYISAIKFPAETEGTIVTFEGLDEARRHPAVHSMTPRMNIGDHALLIKNGGKVLVRGLLFGSDLEQLDRDIDTVRSMIKIVIKD